jgi:nucleoside-diphosphate-sugar epimerase
MVCRRKRRAESVKDGEVEDRTMRVLVAGVAGPTGRLLAEHLLAEPDVESVTGLDARACYPPIPGLRFVRARPRQPEWTPLLHEVDAAIHLDGLRWPLSWSDRTQEMTLVEDSKFFLRAVTEANVPKTILLTTR